MNDLPITNKEEWRSFGGRGDTLILERDSGHDYEFYHPEIFLHSYYKKHDPEGIEIDVKYYYEEFTDNK